MTWPFENDTSDIEKKLAKRSLHRERQRNLFAIIALVLTAFMIGEQESERTGKPVKEWTKAPSTSQRRGSVSFCLF